MKSDHPSIIIAGVGSPVVDQVAQVPETFLASVGGEKGGMELVDADLLQRLLADLPQPPVRAPGGSAGNTAFALARLGMLSRFVGLIGNDAPGHYYRDMFSRIGGDAAFIRTRAGLPTAQCLSLVTPDGERTMRTHLGAAAALRPGDVTPDDFKGCGHAHIEGYLLFNPDLMVHVLQSAKAAGCSTSVDLASFEVVAAAKTELPELLERYVDIVFANEEEAAVYADSDRLEVCLAQLAGSCEIAVIKCGAEGALLRRGDETCRVPAEPVDRVVDTTGAGDLWAAGFLYGLFRGQDLARSATFGAFLGAAVVQQEGAAIPGSAWDRIVGRMAA